MLYVDNCIGHNHTESLSRATGSINIITRYLPKNSAHSIQPCDSFVIQNIESAWCTRWERFKMEMIMQGKWMNGSGKLMNPGKYFFLKLASDAIRDVNGQQDSNGLYFAR